MKKKIFRNVITMAIMVVFMALGLTACGSASKSSSSTKKEIKLGVSPGPYNDLFNAGVKPILEKEGYKVKLVNFSDLLQSEVALTEGSLDFNVAQHNAYVKAYNKEKKANLVSVVKIPTVRAGIFSNKYKSINEVKRGDTVFIPKDPSNAARAYALLEKAGWIKIKEGVTKTLATQKDIVQNKYNLKIVEMDSSQIPRSLNDADYAVLPGAIVYMAKIDANKSLLSETLVDDLYITVAVDGKNKNAKWAQDIVKAYKSQEFKNYLKTHNSKGYWVVPDDLK
ncbi:MULTISPECIES: MetQ/NlpA family ABC transporter substrate-binding protein [Clostridium]|jgi:D-methionine transport system substrate-binding protein|uniref:MetQ/NlpA family ABC transporter substrate-binding protein n=1 Tax=Clostridium lapidicellarium TaxID=3240931 RepID=A0ABV4E067_9CLOT|nr:MetQ/NlpA family ABC transporter substrate-binding protein [uncultured Clostridium sp.]NLU07440.1 metal ABC transporter substrate-binding protein [Clostridiales bacterium]